ncbi:hypothetical protein TWF192_008601 [Orbilia oligospora]|uniref:Uncharacterized protein n=1 Tax=Orbilia oligospora TaxID=2813651 RepID=A0A6G1M239_ORBOL|nr:hypothetical protein TWF191_000372 [Orbilia oligospora]KAF3221411.1 hypothetical protein TWF679_008098 [Orbilia oligospora]KAF3242597.1 hypothetical protein TWF192_008601 [Orbilia oligospora]
MVAPLDIAVLLLMVLLALAPPVTALLNTALLVMVVVLITVPLVTVTVTIPAMALPEAIMVPSTMAQVTGGMRTVVGMSIVAVVVGIMVTVIVAPLFKVIRLIKTSLAILTSLTLSKTSTRKLDEEFFMQPHPFSYYTY